MIMVSFLFFNGWGNGDTWAKELATKALKKAEDLNPVCSLQALCNFGTWIVPLVREIQV
jgi:hypothetical protein